MRIPRGSDALFLLQRVRDEAHRFAIGYHRKLRGRRMTRSALDGVPGLGPGAEGAAASRAGQHRRGAGERLARGAARAPVAPRRDGASCSTASSTTRSRRDPAGPRASAGRKARRRDRHETRSPVMPPGESPTARRRRASRQGGCKVSDYLLITGMSGAGRSTTAAALEDAGWYVIDNMPPSLLDRGGRRRSGRRIRSGPGRARDRAGGGVQVAQALPAVDQLRASGHQVRVIYLDAPDHVLVRRFEGTRRRHPFGGSNVEECDLRRARAAPGDPRQGGHGARHGRAQRQPAARRVTELFGDSAEHRMQTSVVSFGYKHGVPLDADVVFDCRFLPNPHWQDDLRPLSGLDAPVREYVLAQPATTCSARPARLPVGARAPRLRGGGEVVPDDRVRMHRRAAPLGRAWQRRWRGGLPSTAPEPTVFHRDVDR